MDVTEFAEFTQEEQIARLQTMADAALAQFGVESSSIEPLVHAENTTFRVHTDSGDFCLRICRPGYQTDDAIDSELAFLAALTEAGFSVPTPLGRRIKAQVDGVPEPRNCVLFHWQSGDFVKEEFSLDQGRELGKLMARLHEFSQAWQPPPGFDRRDLHAQLFDPMPFENSPFEMTIEDRQLLVETAQESLELISALREMPSQFGLIHGDLHRGNVLFDGDEIRLIDFDDLGDGAWLYDFASALAYQLLRPSGRDVTLAMLAGYEEVHPLPDRARELLPAFLRLRYVIVAKWVLERTDNPRIRETSHEWIATMVSGIRKASDPDFATALRSNAP